MHQEQDSTVLASSTAPWKQYSKDNTQLNTTLQQHKHPKYSRHHMQTDMLSVASLIRWFRGQRFPKADLRRFTDCCVAYRQLFLLVIFSMQAALTIGAICDHNKVLQVLNQDTDTNSTACPAAESDDNVIKIHSEEEH